MDNPLFEPGQQSGDANAKRYAAQRLTALGEEYARRAAQATTLPGQAYWAAASELAIAWADLERG